jgi:murein L,D-transpeptidase YafK
MPLSKAQSQSPRPQPRIEQADKIDVKKGLRHLYLLKNNKILKAYEVTFGANPVGHKTEAGDERTPEGLYFISAKRSDSQFYKALQISYPNRRDREQARQRGVDPGDFIMIHGLPDSLVEMPDFLQNLHDWFNWTDGCIAVTNREMNEIFQMVPVRTPIEIFP